MEFEVSPDRFVASRSGFLYLNDWYKSQFTQFCRERQGYQSGEDNVMLTQIQRSHVLKAMEEYDLKGQTEFLREYGFGKAKDYLVVHDDRYYDSKAIMGVAFKYVGDGGQALKASQFSGGAATVAKRLKELGFVCPPLLED